MSWTSDSDNEPQGHDQARDPYATPDPGRPAQPPDPKGQPPAYGQPPAWSEGQGGVAGEEPQFGQRQYGQPAPSEPPQSVLTAVKLMYVGAGLAVLSLITTFVARDEIREQTIDSAVDGGMSVSEAESLADSSVAVVFVISALVVGLWIWMARANRRGKRWARVTATVLGGLNIVFTLGSLVSGGSGLNFVVSLVTLALAAYILWLLYRPGSSAYFQASSRQF